MLPAISISQVEWLCSQTQPPKIPHRRRMLGLLFARPGVKLAKEQVFPNLQYFHKRSGRHIDFFCAGVAKGEMRIADHQFGEHDYVRVTSVDSDYHKLSDYDRVSPYLYSDSAFVDFCEEVEAKSTWRYSGETDLLLMDCEIARGGAAVDFSQVVALNLDELVRAGVVSSITALFETIVRQVQPTNVMNPKLTLDVSDALGGRAVTKLTYEALLKLLPSQASQALTAIRYLRTKDIGAA
jgi:hypothetical protein